MQRLSASAAHFGFPFDPVRVAKALDALAVRYATGVWRVRLLCDRQGRVRTECLALESTPREVAVMLADKPIEGDSEMLTHKTTERSAYHGFEPAAGCFDTLLWNKRGEITEFTRGNVVLEIHGRRVTPPAACGLLPGVLRAELLANGEIEEGRVLLDELPQATRIWFINSVRGMIVARLGPT